MYMSWLCYHGGCRTRDRCSRPLQPRHFPAIFAETKAVCLTRLRDSLKPKDVRTFSIFVAKETNIFNNTSGQIPAVFVATEQGKHDVFHDVTSKHMLSQHKILNWMQRNVKGQHAFFRKCTRVTWTLPYRKTVGQSDFKVKHWQPLRLIVPIKKQLCANGLHNTKHKTKHYS